jgi:hypothetical protein
VDKSLDTSDIDGTVLKQMINASIDCHNRVKGPGMGIAIKLNENFRAGHGGAFCTSGIA